MSINDWDEETDHDYEDKLSLGILDKNTECKGYSSFNGESTEYDCEYEFAGEVTCDECIFGSCGGTKDPRVDTFQTEIDDDCPNCKHESHCPGGCETDRPLTKYRFEDKEETA